MANHNKANAMQAKQPTRTRFGTTRAKDPRHNAGQASNDYDNTRHNEGQGPPRHNAGNHLVRLPPCLQDGAGGPNGLAEDRGSRAHAVRRLVAHVVAKVVVGVLDDL